MILPLIDESMLIIPTPKQTNQLSKCIRQRFDWNTTTMKRHRTIVHLHLHNFKNKEKVAE